MEGLRHSLLAPAGGTVLVLYSTVDALMRMIKVRYSAKDDAGKPLFSLPYAPWDKPDAKYDDQSAKVLRAFRMFENVKEWTLMGLPMMWIFSLYGGGLPYVTDNIMDVATIGSSLAFGIANTMYATGYIESTQGRLKAFAIRKTVIQFWLYGAVIGVGCGALNKFGIWKK